MFGPAGQQNFSLIQLAQVARQLDFFNLQGYDFHGTWEMSTNHASPLFDDKQDPDASENFYIEYTVRSYLAAGVPGAKLVLGTASASTAGVSLPAMFTLSGTPAVLTVTANSVSRMYGAANPALTFTVAGLFKRRYVLGSLGDSD
jgi:GH18 family chitinase